MSDSVIVTGSDSGIGRATAIALARAGFSVGVTWHTDEAGAVETVGAVRAAGADAELVRLDLTDRPGEAIAELATALGNLWGLVACAGANHRAGTLDDEPDAWRRALEVNLTGPFLCGQAAAQRLVGRGQGGRIVFVTSVHEHVPLRYAAAYAAAKAGLGMAARVMALELATFGVTVNAVAPGHIATPMTGKAGIDPHSVALEPIPLGRPGAPEEVASTIAHLVSRQAGYVTGSSFVVDGGLLLTTAAPLQRLVEGDGWNATSEAVERAGDRAVTDRASAAGLRALQAGPVVILLVLVVAMSALSPYFLTGRNLANVGFQASFVAVLALGQLLVIITRGIDLSVGSAVGLAGVVAAASPSIGGAGSLALFVGTGLAVGLANGAVLVYGRVMNPFIVTLGTLGIARGLALVISDGETRTGLPAVVGTLGSDSIAGIPVPVLLVAALALVLGTLLGRTQWGRWIYAVGGNPDGARRAGIPADGVLVSVYALCGLLAGVAAILVAGRTDSASPQAGQLLELDAITAVIIGGASFLGGRGRVVNVLAGALIIGVIRNGLDLLGVSPFWQLIAVGALVILSLELDVIRGRLERRLRSQAART